MELTKTKSRLTDTLEVVEGGYKVIANVVIEEGAIKSLSGYVKEETDASEGYSPNTTSWSASKQNDKWGVRIDWLTLEEQDKVSDIVTDVVTAVVAEYEA